MAINKRAKGKKGSKKRPAKGGNEVRIAPAQRRRVIDTLEALKKDAKDIELRIERVRKTLCEVDFRSDFRSS